MKRAILHFRQHKGNILKNNGGATIAVEKRAGGYVLGHARCSTSDGYNKKVGRLIATGRLSCPRVKHSLFDKDSICSVLKHHTKRYREEYTDAFFQRLLDKLEDAK